MKKLILFVVAMVYAGAFLSGAFQPIHNFMLSWGKSETITEMAMPESITMVVGDEAATPMTMTTADGRSIAPEQIAMIWKEYKMVFVTTNPDVVFVNRAGVMTAMGEGTVILTATSYNTDGIEGKMKIEVLPKEQNS